MNDTGLEKSKYPVKSLIKALRILNAIGESPSGCGIVELSRKLQIGKSTVHRLLATLRDEGFVMVDPTMSTHTLGVKISQLHERLTIQVPLLRQGVPILQRLSERCNETTNLACLEGREVLYLAKYEAPEPLRASGIVGKRLPAYSTALGKVILADLPEDEFRILYGISQFSRNSRHIPLVL